jgi:hypothetical protein
VWLSTEGRRKMANYKKIAKRAIWGIIFSIIIVIGGLFTSAMLQKKYDPKTVYFEDKFHTRYRDFIKQAFDHIPNAQKGQYALVLGADIAESDTIYPLEKDYNILVMHSGMIQYYDLMIPEEKRYKDKIQFVSSEQIEDFKALPAVNLVMASFILPFYNPEDFDKVWQEIDTKMLVGGYFIGNFFDTRWDILPEDILRKFLTRDVFVL